MAHTDAPAAFKNVHIPHALDVGSAEVGGAPWRAPTSWALS